VENSITRVISTTRLRSSTLITIIGRADLSAWPSCFSLQKHELSALVTSFYV
jgi:hypothetical protein